MSNGTPPDPDDFFAETRMSFGDHIEELRTHLWRAIAGFGIALFVSFFFGHLVVQVITAPVKNELTRFYERRQKQVLAERTSNAKITQANQATPFRAVLLPREQVREQLRSILEDYRYKITDRSLSNLKENKDPKNPRIPDEVLAKLEKLKDRPFRTKELFVAELGKTLSEEELKQFEPEVLTWADPTIMPRPRILTEDQVKAKTEPQGFGSRIVQWWKSLGGEEEADPADTAHKGMTFDINEKEKDEQLIRLWQSYENPLYVAADIQPANRIFLDVENASTLNVQEAFMVWFKVCMVCGIVLGSPWIFWQIWMFVAAGLYPTEKRLVHVYLPVSLFLFLSGVLICEFLVIPRAIEALLWFNEIMGLKPDMRLNEWLSFAIWMPVIFGASFQTPLVMLFLNRLGIVDVDTFRNRRRMAWFLMAIFAAIITPSTDALSMLFLWVPMSLLFELGIILIKHSPNQQDLGVHAPEVDEMVEV